MIYEYLKANYELGEPIFISDIDIPNMTKVNMRYRLKKLTDDGKLCRFDDGIYYLPKINFLGDVVQLSAETIMMHKYISRKGKTVGYYSGFTLANRMGVSTQVPMVEEVISNNAPALVREIMIDNQKFVLRKPVVQITTENVKVLQFLDCLKDIDRYAEEPLNICGEILTAYATKFGITKEMIDTYIKYYPAKIYKAIYETEVKYVSARK